MLIQHFVALGLKVGAACSKRDKVGDIARLDARPAAQSLVGWIC